MQVAPSGDNDLTAAVFVFRNHAGHFFLCFCWFLNFRKCFFFLSRSYIHTLAVGNTPYGKCHTSRTTSVKPLQSISGESLHSRQYFWVLLTWIRRMLQPGKRLRDDATNNTLPTWKTYEFAPPMLFGVELRRQCQPLIFRPMPTSNRL